jgi:hypothetical protein
MSLEKFNMNNPSSNNESEAGYTKKLTKKEMDKIDPVSKKTWRELVYGIEEETLKDVTEKKEPKGTKGTIFDMLHDGKKEKKKVSRNDILDIMECYHDAVRKMRSFLVPVAQKYFPNLDADEARKQMELVAIQMLMRSQDSASLEAVKKALKEIGEVEYDPYGIFFPKDKEKDSFGGTRQVLEKKGKDETATEEALRKVRDYFDMQAKIYGMLDSGKYFPKIGEYEEDNRLAIIAIENCLRLHDKLSFKAVRRILKDEEKYIKENKKTPLALLFAQIKPQVDLLLKE